MESLLNYCVYLHDLTPLDQDYHGPDHDPDLIPHCGCCLHHEDDGGDLVMTIGLIETPLMGKNRICL